jgi:hypothetical protein
MPDQARPAVTTATDALPIQHSVTSPSLQALTFVSDAAGAQFIQNDNLFTPYSVKK